MRQTRVVRLDDYEHRVMVATLNAFRNQMIELGKPTEDIDELLLKTIDAPLLRGHRRNDL